MSSVVGTSTLFLQCTKKRPNYSRHICRLDRCAALEEDEQEANNKLANYSSCGGMLVKITLNLFCNSIRNISEHCEFILLQ